MPIFYNDNNIESFGINEFEISISACLGVHTMQQSTNTITSHFIIIYSFSNKRKIK
jgi:hypothetical protein